MTLAVPTRRPACLQSVLVRRRRRRPRSGGRAGVRGLQYRFEPADLPTRMLSVQPSVYTDASARRDWAY